MILSDKFQYFYLSSLNEYNSLIFECVRAVYWVYMYLKKNVVFFKYIYRTFQKTHELRFSFDYETFELTIPDENAILVCLNKLKKF